MYIREYMYIGEGMASSSTRTNKILYSHILFKLGGKVKKCAKLKEQSAIA